MKISSLERLIGLSKKKQKNNNTQAAVRSIIESEFDASFYRATYRDITATVDPLQHYISHGWREGRDPSPTFSTQFYLIAHPDVRQAQVDPFYHYIVRGRAEGRLTMPSDAKPPRAPETSSGAPRIIDAIPPRIGVVAMVRNEGDIIDSFARHITALFDVVVFVDHRSQDGTFEYLQSLERANPSVTLYRFEEEGYIQAPLTNFLVRSCRKLAGLDWIFVLDADEFLPFEDRAAFHQAMIAHSEHAVIAMAWRNLVPCAYWDYQADVAGGVEFFYPSRSSNHKKVAFQPKRLGCDGFWIVQGNHSIQRFRDGPSLKEVSASFDLLHLPIRSVSQLKLKIAQGTASYSRLGKDRRQDHGAHWFQIASAIKDVAVTPETLNAIASNYGEAVPNLSSLSARELMEHGYSSQRLAIASSDAARPVDLLCDIESLIEHIKNQDPAVDDHGFDARSPIRLTADESGVIRRLPRATDYTFARLGPIDGTEESLHVGSSTDLALLNVFLRPSYWPIQVLTPSAWGGHIPFMFSLVPLLRPRVYVELGTHYGASFFAFCQAALRSELVTMPVAIDSWEGDEHAGAYDHRVFDQFRFVLRRYEHFAWYLKLYFDEAAKRFEDGSIDLLMIDGLHTYEAVRHDYRTWISKVSSRGVIMFHDINVHERDFGVWQLWSEIKTKYPTIEFPHSFGLGVAYVGSVSGTAIERLITILHRDPALLQLVQHHFASLGEKSVALFTKTHEIGRLEEQTKCLGKQNDELSRLRQQLAVMKAERWQIRFLRSRLGRKPQWWKRVPAKTNA